MIIASCSTDDFDRVIWREDTENPGLPQYSEWGYNTFGAYINGRVFTNADEDNDWEVNHSLVTSKDDILYITLKSKNDEKWNDGTQSFSTIISDSLTFAVPYKHIYEFSMLDELNGKTFDLASEDCTTIIKLNEGTNGKSAILNVQSGYLDIKRVQILYVNGRKKEAVISGVFEAKTTVDIDGKERHFDITEGRFDIGINSNQQIEID